MKRCIIKKKKLLLKLYVQNALYAVAGAAAAVADRFATSITTTTTTAQSTNAPITIPAIAPSESFVVDGPPVLGGLVDPPGPVVVLGTDTRPFRTEGGATEVLA